MTITDAILLGGGVGRRFSTGAATPKQFQLVGGAPVFLHALRALATLPSLRNFLLTVPESHVELAEEQLSAHLSPELRLRVRVIPGGARRQDSAFHALEAIDPRSAPARVLIHDACRPHLSTELLRELEKRIADASFPAWIPVIPVVETLKRVEANRVVETVDRAAYHRVQTPQLFDYELIRELSRKVRSLPELTFTDDASICEYFGAPVGVFPGDVRNLKLTYEHEREILESLFSKPSPAEQRPIEPKPIQKDTACAPASATTSTDSLP